MASTLPRQLRGFRAKLLRRYEHRPFVSCLSGLYSCQWRHRERNNAEPGDCCCNKLEGACFALLAAAFCLTLVFLYFWVQAQNDYNDFDWWVQKHIIGGRTSDWIVFLQVPRSKKISW